MRAVVVTDRNAGTAGMTVSEQPDPHAAENDVVVRVHASGFTTGELSWPSTWTDRAGRDRTPSIPGHELSGIVTELGYGTTGLTVGQRVFGFADWTRDGSLAELVAVEARNLAPLPADIDHVTAASLPISGLTAWQGLFEHAGLRTGQTILVHGAAGGVGSFVTQLAREHGAHVIGTGRAAHRDIALELGAHSFADLGNGDLEEAGPFDVVFDVFGGDIARRSAALLRPGGILVSVAEPVPVSPDQGRTAFFVVEPSRPQLAEIATRVRTGRLRSLIGRTVTLDGAPDAFTTPARRAGRTMVQLLP
ncbi:NADP-dependent oxidoreductase [Actinoplanes sp. NPDC051861]|uniref:NADP-dependent oxidoreductase n=1 Tax=Actinoplanes sp. NPDC051861 TaxID=3155170 RepID=UPI003419491F